VVAQFPEYPVLAPFLPIGLPVEKPKAPAQLVDQRIDPLFLGHGEHLLENLSVPIELYHEKEENVNSPGEKPLCFWEFVV
jgi:hypothetical protein